MQRYFIKDEQINDLLVTISGSDFHHIKNVMRFKVGTNVTVVSYSGKTFLTELITFDKSTVTLKIVEELAVINNTLNITLAQALIKREKFELVLQKASELGVKEIIPLETKHSIIKIDNFDKKKLRYETIVKEAAEQSERNTVPKISEISDIKSLPFEDYDFVLTAYARNEQVSLLEELKQIPSNKSVLLLIGPEGGFDPLEIEFLESKSKLISLGNTILRSETAAIYLISAIRLIWEN
ncbi:MAG: 16S rRNA (uracil(1498)-N(3))-methyltransferase [Tenericutes bacterium]|nr:16S rRNA (uracil(1498)-N(3))-methyltransferase [Mycoplasmatota bacterium]